jgi:hypothetical protein
VNVGPLSLVLPPVLSMLAPSLSDGTVHVAAGFGAQLRRLQDGISEPSVPLCVFERTATSRREVPVAKVTEMGQVGPFLSPCRM